MNFRSNYLSASSLRLGDLFCISEQSLNLNPVDLSLGGKNRSDLGLLIEKNSDDAS